MSARVQWSGLEDLREALRRLPADLAGEAGNLVEGAANAATVDIRSSYPVRTGNLRDHVTVNHQQSGPYGVVSVVKNTAKHAYIFEQGTQARHTSIGANRGSMPPGRVFVPRVIRHRRSMYERLKDLLVRHGLVVTGEP